MNEYERPPRGKRNARIAAQLNERGETNYNSAPSRRIALSPLTGQITQSSGIDRLALRRTFWAFIKECCGCGQFQDVLCSLNRIKLFRVTRVDVVHKRRVRRTGTGRLLAIKFNHFRSLLRARFCGRRQLQGSL